MAVDRSHSQQNVEAILKRLNDYIAIRFDQAVRITPRLRSVKDDLMYHEMENVRRALQGEKIYGSQRLVVADVFMSDDDKKRKGLMSTTDQTSIQVELVSHVREDVKQATRGQIKIHDLKTFYSAIDPVLTDMMDLIETWIWWDIFDAVELARFEQKLGIVQAVRAGRCTPELRKHYSNLIAPPQDVEKEDELHVAADEEILQYELEKLILTRDMWRQRQLYEFGYQFVLKRDELPPPDQGALIHKIAERVREYDRIETMAELEEDAKHAYAPELKIAPAKVTRELVLEYLQAGLVEIEREMVGNCEGDIHLGPPYRYKMRQLEFMEKWLRDLYAQVKDVLKQPQTA